MASLLAAIGKGTYKTAAEATGAVAKTAYRSVVPDIKSAVFRLGLIGPVIENIADEYRSDTKEVKQEEKKQTKQQEDINVKVEKMAEELSSISKALKTVVKNNIVDLNDERRKRGLQEFKAREDAQEAKPEEKQGIVEKMKAKTSGFVDFIKNFFLNNPLLATAAGLFIAKKLYDLLPQDIKDKVVGFVDGLTGISNFIPTLIDTIETAAGVLLGIAAFKGLGNLLMDALPGGGGGGQKKPNTPDGTNKKPGDKPGGARPGPQPPAPSGGPVPGGPDGKPQPSGTPGPEGKPKPKPPTRERVKALLKIKEGPLSKILGKIFTRALPALGVAFAAWDIGARTFSGDYRGAAASAAQVGIGVLGLIGGLFSGGTATAAGIIAIISLELYKAKRDIYIAYYNTLPEDDPDYEKHADALVEYMKEEAEAFVKSYFGGSNTQRPEEQSYDAMGNYQPSSPEEVSPPAAAAPAAKPTAKPAVSSQPGNGRAGANTAPAAAMAPAAAPAPAPEVPSLDEGMEAPGARLGPNAAAPADIKNDGQSQSVYDYIGKLFHLNYQSNRQMWDNLTPGFASTLIKMAEEYKKLTGKTLGLTDGWRSRAQQEQAYRTKPHLAAPPGKSKHEFGLAVDVTPSQGNELAAMGLLEKYGLHRPALSKGETWHIEPKNANESLASGDFTQASNLATEQQAAPEQPMNMQDFISKTLQDSPLGKAMGEAMGGINSSMVDISKQFNDALMKGLNGDGNIGNLTQGVRESKESVPAPVITTDASKRINAKQGNPPSRGVPPVDASNSELDQYTYFTMR